MNVKITDRQTSTRGLDIELPRGVVNKPAGTGYLRLEPMSRAMIRELGEAIVKAADEQPGEHGFYR